MFLPVGVFAALVGIFAVQLSGDGKALSDDPMAGKAVPAFELPGYNNAHPGINSAELADGEVKIINIFGTWCPPCIAELPVLKTLSETHGVPIHAIAYRDTPAQLDKVFSRHPNPFSRIGLDPYGRAALSFGITGAPESFIVDGKGIMRHRHVGEVREEDIPEILDLIADARE